MVSAPFLLTPVDVTLSDDRMILSANLLSEILASTSESTLQGKRVLGVFDLDSTLFDVSPRLQRILDSFASSPTIQNLHPTKAQRLQQIKIQHKDWGLKTAIQRAGIENDSPELAQAIRAYWGKNFFSNDHLHHDVPMPGAVQFVQVFQSLGGEVIYLTGRDVARMQEGTIKSLQTHQLPLSSDHHELVMKPHGTEDETFKERWFRQLAKDQFHHIWFFENEPVNLELIRRSHPEVDLIFIDSTHSNKLPSPTHLHWIEDFQVDWSQVKEKVAIPHRHLLPGNR